MLELFRSRLDQGRDRIWTAFGEQGDFLIHARERCSTFVYLLLFLIWTGRYAQALNTPAPGSLCTNVDVVKWNMLLC